MAASLVGAGTVTVVLAAATEAHMEAAGWVAAAVVAQKVVVTAAAVAPTVVVRAAEKTALAARVAATVLVKHRWSPHSLPRGLQTERPHAGAPATLEPSSTCRSTPCAHRWHC